MAQDEMTIDSRPAAVVTTDEDHAKIQTYEEAFRRIKEATGVSGTQACVPVIYSLTVTVTESRNN